MDLIGCRPFPLICSQDSPKHVILSVPQPPAMVEVRLFDDAGQRKDIIIPHEEGDDDDFESDGENRGWLDVEGADDSWNGNDRFNSVCNFPEVTFAALSNTRDSI